jgi:phosphoglycolate phosphatase
MERLVLFDIDGTLLSTGGAGGRALRLALLEVYGTAGPIDSHSFAGKTDPQIVMELLGAAGFSDDQIDERLATLWDAYLSYLPGELARTPTEVFPGVPTLLDRLESEAPATRMGLLTGNLAEGARLKLHSAGIDAARFEVGAFGSDHARREALPAIAAERARARFSHHLRGDRIVIIGDTPNDIACGASLRVRTIAVATGTYSASELAACEPDHLFPTLEDTDAVLGAILR